jgi:KaiC/GvpD/RAD55 family RecA-like ATPase
MEGILHQAEQLEKDYDWLGAAGQYEKTLELPSDDDFSRRGEIYERLGYVFYRGAFQAESGSDFQERIQKAAKDYGEARELYGKLNGSMKTRMLRCDALIAYMGYWLAAEVPEKRRLLDECSRSARQAMKSYDEGGDQIDCAKMCLELAEFLDARLDLELDTQMRVKILDEALSVEEKAILIISNAGDEHELARAYCIASVTCFNAAMSLQLETKRRECEKKTFDYAKEGIRISESVGDKFLLGRSTVSLGQAELDLGAGSDIASELFQKALQCCIQVKDHRILSEAYDGLAFSTWWSMITEEDLEKIREKSRKGEEYASEAIRSSTLINYCQGIPHSYSFGYVENFLGLAKREIGLETRHELLKKAVALGKRGLERAQLTGSTHAILHASWYLAQALCDLSTVATGVERKKLLEDALTLGEKTVHYTEQLRPQYLLPQSLPHGVLATILLELSNLEDDREKRKELLEKAVSRMETCIALLQKHVTSFPSRRELFASVGNYLTSLGKILDHLYQTTAEKDTLRKLIETQQSAVQMNKKADLASRVAEAYWQIAMAYDRLDEHSESASNFDFASKQYEISSYNIHQLSKFYMDYATYMQAWAEIETARDHHEREEYDLAKEHFEKAANLHESLKQWNYLAPNYFAWTRLEEAEELSRKEQTEEAANAFKATANLFSETKKTLQAQLDKIENPDERQMAISMVKATDTRREYSAARIAVEEARILDKKGDHYRSSEKYESAGNSFEKIGRSLESEQERREFRLIAALSRAWQKMTLAEAEGSPALYVEASKLFEEAREFSPNEKTKMLLLGHSRFCKALEAGTEFADSRDTDMYVSAVRYLESAASYYVKAGFPKASEYSEATKLLFDAYMHTESAGRESDPERKVKLYAVAEKVLQTSAGFFLRAEHPEKREQVLGLLEKVKKEQEVATSLMEVLHAPAVVSTTTSFSTPASAHEQAVGSERFEHADIQANLIIRQKDLKIGENLNIELELVNAGKGFAILTKVTEIIPPGFELAEKPDNCRVEDSYLNMKGRRLDPLKTEEVKLILKPTLQGTFTLKPTLLYLDENGKYKSHEPEPVTIVVKPELIQVSRDVTRHVATGYPGLDNLLYGGIPENYAVTLTSPSCDERDSLIRCFLENGAKNAEVTFYVTTDPGSAEPLAGEFQSNFFLFICNPQAETIVRDLPNVLKLKGVENLTDISIALASTIRKLDPSLKGPRRICIGLTSDILLQHHAVQTRRWLTALITELKSTGFTTLAVMDPQMHPSEELHAILGLFDGEINIYEKETDKGPEKFLKIKRMSKQEHLGNEIALTKTSRVN